MHRVIHFEINADQPERAAKFYQDVFDWNIGKWNGPSPYWMIDTGKEEPGINGGLMNRIHPGAKNMINIVEVENVDVFAEKIIDNGGKVTIPKMSVFGVGYMAYCQDTEGNTFGIMQNDKDAK
jgi:predicted enzyme related to lactoylglutathione lyase